MIPMDISSQMHLTWWPTTGSRFVRFMESKSILSSNAASSTVLQGDRKSYESLLNLWVCLKKCDFKPGIGYIMIYIYIYHMWCMCIYIYNHQECECWVSENGDWPPGDVNSSWWKRWLPSGRNRVRYLQANPNGSYPCQNNWTSNLIITQGRTRWCPPVINTVNYRYIDISWYIYYKPYWTTSPLDQLSYLGGPTLNTK